MLASVLLKIPQMYVTKDEVVSLNATCKENGFLHNIFWKKYLTLIV